MNAPAFTLPDLTLRVELLSDATFSAGEGLAGRVDTEVDHDESGLPRVRGRVLKGLLVEECANVLWSLRLIMQKSGLSQTDFEAFESAARFLFGAPGSELEARSALDVDAAQLPLPLRQVVAAEIAQGNLKPHEVLEAFTAIRRQTAITAAGPEAGVPETASLRAVRVLTRKQGETPTVLRAPVGFTARHLPAACDAGDVQMLLAACTLATRRGGQRRNRGAGRLRCRLESGGRDVTLSWLGEFPLRAAAQGGEGAS